MASVSIVGGSGYGGGELLRLLLGHPKVRVKQVTSQRLVGQPVSLPHPNLRGVSDLHFCAIDELKKCDVLFITLPNGESMHLMERFTKIAPKIIDCGADFRLQTKEAWQKWYQSEHRGGRLVGQFIYGLPELHRAEIKRARYVAVPGCEAVVSLLCLWPLVRSGCIDLSRIVIDAKMSSSQAGNKATQSSHHPERTGVVRSYLPTGHRHTVEIEQELTFGAQRPTVMVSATAVEMVRGVLVTIHTFLKNDAGEKEIWKIYREAYANEPFIRIVKERQGLYRFPEPKILQGTNFCEIGFAKDNHSSRLVIIGAIDNLVKGTAGNAVQCMNLMCGFAETTGLTFPGLHPI